MTTPTPADEVRQLVVHPAVWPHLTAWLNARGIDVNLMTPAGDDLATYVMSPRDLAAAPAPDGGETAAVRPQERPEGGGESPAASEAPSGPQAGAQPSNARTEVWPLARILAEVAVGSHSGSWDEEFADLDARHPIRLAELERAIARDGITTPVYVGSDGRLWDGHHRLRIAARLGIGEVPVLLTAPAPVTHPHHDHDGVEWTHPGRAEDCDLPDCAEPAGDDVDEQAACTATITEPGGTVACILPPGHDGDHGRGFLRWDDTGDWCSQRYVTRDGISHGLPYPVEPDPQPPNDLLTEEDAPAPLLARLTDVIAHGRAELHTNAEIARDVWAETTRPAPGDGLREEIITAVRARIGSQWISSGNGLTYQTDYGRVADAVMERVQPRLDAAHRRAEEAEAALARVRAECDALDSVLGYLSPVAREAQREAVRCILAALDGTDTPTETTS